MQWIVSKPNLIKLTTIITKFIWLDPRTYQFNIDPRNFIEWLMKRFYLFPEPPKKWKTSCSLSLLPVTRFSDLKISGLVWDRDMSIYLNTEWINEWKRKFNPPSGFLWSTGQKILPRKEKVFPIIFSFL